MTFNDKIAVAIVLVTSFVVFAFCATGLVKSLSSFFYKEETTAKVVDWVKKDADIYIIYEYFNENENVTYTIEKKFPRRSLEEFEDKKEIKIYYSSIFAEETRIYGVSENTYIYLLLGCIISATAIFRSIQVFRKKLSLKDFL